MATPAELYVKGIKRKLKSYYAAWLPNSRLQLGDVGVLKGKFFTQVTSLRDLGIDFEVRDDPDPSPIDYTSESGVAITLKAAGEISTSLPSVPEGEAGIGISFSREGAFVVQAAQSFEPAIENSYEVGKKIKQLLKEKKWEKNWAVIVRLVHTPVATILISNSSESSIEVSAKADAEIGELNLGDASVEFLVKRQSGDVFKSIGAENITPFFQLARLKRPILGVIGRRRITYAKTRPSPLELMLPSELEENEEVLDELYLDLIEEEEE